jgi:molybdopterin-guanine dinucleotide biosynthesis protein A
LLRAEGMLMVGASARKLGKTELACKLIAHAGAHPVTAIKVTTVEDHHTDCPAGREGCGVCASLKGPFAISEETDPTGDKDTSRLLAAGAIRVLWLRVRQAHLAEGSAALMQRLGPDALSICESNSLRQVIEPDLYLQVRGELAGPIKASAGRVRPAADRLLRPSVAGDSFDLDEVRVSAGRWSMPVAACAIVMAGGSSSRMGTDKSLLPVGDRPLIASVVDQLRPWMQELIVSANDPERFAFLNLPIVTDKRTGQGPLMGIASSLQASTHERNLVVACDIPLVDRALGRAMLARAEIEVAEAVVPKDSAGYREPLFAVYRKSMAEPMFDCLKRDQRGIVQAFEGRKVCYQALDSDEGLTNLNTKQDWQKFQERSAWN